LFRELTLFLLDFPFGRGIWAVQWNRPAASITQSDWARALPHCGRGRHRAPTQNLQTEEIDQGRPRRGQRLDCQVHRAQSHFAEQPRAGGGHRAAGQNARRHQR
jgi:hypothetical protein